MKKKLDELHSFAVKVIDGLKEIEDAIEREKNNDKDWMNQDIFNGLPDYEPSYSLCKKYPRANAYLQYSEQLADRPDILLPVLKMIIDGYSIEVIRAVVEYKVIYEPYYENK